MEGRGGCSWQEVGTGAGLEGEGGFFLGKHRAGRGRAAGDSESPARAPPRPGSGRSLLRRRVFYWGRGVGTGTSSKCVHGLVLRDRGLLCCLSPSPRIICGGVRAKAQPHFPFREPRLMEPDGGSGMPGGLRGDVPDSSVVRGWKEESALHLN